MTLSNYFLIFYLSLVALSVNADEFEKYLNEQNSASQKDNILFQQATEKEQKEFKEYRKKILVAYENYKKQISKFWGKDNTVISSNRKWVEYHDNLRQRHVVDFEKGIVTVEVVLDNKDKNNIKVIKEKLNHVISRTVTKKADTRSILEIVKNPAESESRLDQDTIPVLKNQVMNNQGNLVSVANAKNFSNEVAEKPFKLKQQKGSDGAERTIATATFPLIPGHIQKRAERFKVTIKKYANHFNVSQNLVFAVIETESFFNPVARSNAPAFGLMQLVPHYGAREAYRFLYKQDKIVSDRYLYNAKNNIQLGSAYLHVLYFKHMNEITDPQTRLWCSIAAYNTGPSNVFRAIIGKYRRSIYRKHRNWKEKAIKEINKMSSEQLFLFLRRKLPYPETRSYIQKVRSRMAKYSSF